ncbi:AraC family transcriptional regulator [Eubacteriales bacterium OttesenSCG-928-N13]|nr:AraC family transcriptional regulator [Eubacteriales bacterium OttesenSCG-928-N13]
MEIWTSQGGADGALNVCQCGWEACDPGHQYGPTVRDHYLIHFVASGSGRFWTAEREYHLGVGQGFLILPGQLTGYRADEGDPWLYGWVGYTGHDAEMRTRQAGLSMEQPVFSCAGIERVLPLIRQMHADVAELRMGALAAQGALQMLLALIAQQRPEQSDAQQAYYRRAMWYMEGNYTLPIRIEDVAKFVGLSRSQLFRVFQRAAGVSPKAALSEIRMNRAKMLLREPDLTLEQVASSVGVAGAARLGVLFREAYGITAGRYRRDHLR